LTWFSGDAEKHEHSKEEPEVLNTGRASKTVNSLSKANDLARTINILFASLAVLSGVQQLMSGNNEFGWILMATGVAYAVPALLAYFVIETFSDHVRINAEILEVLQKANDKN
jgi:hypothetical protein